MLRAIDDQTLSSNTLGRLISGYLNRQTAQYQAPTTRLEDMADRLKVTFRPLPKRFGNIKIRRFRTELRHKLRDAGVSVVPWVDATFDHYHTMVAPLINRRVSFKRRVVKKEINAVIDVERPCSPARRIGIAASEALYRLDSLFRSKDRPLSIPAIARLSIWAEDHAVRHIQDYVSTQIVMLTEFDDALVNPRLPYDERIALGLTALAESFAPIVIGTCGSRFSILNLNLADSVFDSSQIGSFVHHCLIPKLYLPITPLLAGQFDVERYDPRRSKSARQVVELGRSLEPTRLLPDGHRMRALLKRKSRRDMAKVLVDGRTGVSFGFIAFAEPPRYVGPREISEADWRRLSPVDELPDNDVRRNDLGRQYLRICAADRIAYRQVPDVWIASSRSGANKTDLDIEKDVVRVGYKNGLSMQLPDGTPRGRSGAKPSYDLRVMLAQVLSTALHWPGFLDDGAPLFHFHGYPHREWFSSRECFAGADNPSVPCGTLEAGVFNFQAISDMAFEQTDRVRLACIIEPDHGTNFIARDVGYLVDRVKAGVACGLIALGGRHFASLKRALPVSTGTAHTVHREAVGHA